MRVKYRNNVIECDHGKLKRIIGATLGFKSMNIAQGWLYLAVVRVLCSRKIVSRAFSDKPDSTMTIRALRLAINKTVVNRPCRFPWR